MRSRPGSEVFVTGVSEADMGSRSEQLLIVVSILEGRHFPRGRPGESVMVRASFDGETLSTDPVEQRERPTFCTELAWELTRRSLHQHRLQRTPIKLTCFSVDQLGQKNLGYIVLELRSVQEQKQEPRWFPLLSCKFSKHKPALLLGLQLETDRKPALTHEQDTFRAKKAPPRTACPALGVLPERLQTVLVPDQGYHQLGPEHLSSDMFLLSVTVAFATELQQLIPSDQKLALEGSDFFFYYSLLGNDVTSDAFSSLLSPAFHPERASVRLRTNKHLLQTFLLQENPLQIHLCCGSLSLGSADVSLAPLSSPSVDLGGEGATVEGAFVLKPSPPRKHQSGARASVGGASAGGASVGVAVTLRREPSSQTLEPKDIASSSVPDPPPAQSAPAPDPDPASAPQLLSPVTSVQPGPGPGSVAHTESEADSVMEEIHNKTPPDPPTDSDLSSVSAPSVHHYNFSLDLQSLSNKNNHDICAFLRYQYVLFDSVAPVETREVELLRSSETKLPQASCTFYFTALPQQLQDTFSRFPLVVELWHRPLSSRDELIGRASLQLSHLLRSPRVKVQRSTGDQSWRQTQQETVTFRSTEAVVELTYSAALEDLGLVRDSQVLMTQSSPNEAEAPSVPPAGPPVSSVAPSVPPAGPSVPPRQTAEYRAALELELWKEEQEELFDLQLRQKEQSHMKTLAEEWRRRDQEREALLHKKELEYSRLEEQLQKTLAELEQREKKLTEAELQTERLQAGLRTELALAQRELRETSERQKVDCEHLVELEKHKNRLLEENQTRLTQQVSDAETRFKALEKEFQTYREQQNLRPEFRLQSDLNLLTLEKVELERKLDSTTKSKLHYKQQWGRALKELARFKQKEQENAVVRLKKQQQELETLRQKFLTSEEKQELQEIRNHLNRLKDDTTGPAPSVPDPAPLEDHVTDHVTRLLEERDTLLRTGVYHHDDRIIAELSRQIQDAMATAAQGC